MSKALFDDLKQKWPSTWVSRREVGKFSGGILHPRTLANLDCQGVGPKGRIRIMGGIAYPVDELVSWMEAKARQEA